MTDLVQLKVNPSGGGSESQRYQTHPVKILPPHTESGLVIHVGKENGVCPCTGFTPPTLGRGPTTTLITLFVGPQETLTTDTKTTFEPEESLVSVTLANTGFYLGCGTLEARG